MVAIFQALTSAGFHELLVSFLDGHKFPVCQLLQFFSQMGDFVWVILCNSNPVGRLDFFLGGAGRDAQRRVGALMVTFFLAMGTGGRVL